MYYCSFVQLIAPPHHRTHLTISIKISALSKYFFVFLNDCLLLNSRKFASNNFVLYSYFSIVANMEGPEVTFLFQFGNLRDMVTVPASTINLRSLKDLACDFINSKVSLFYFSFLLTSIDPVSKKTININFLND